MARFNQSVSAKIKTENLAGGDAYVQNPKVEFVSILLTSFVTNQFYREADETMERVTELMDKISDKKFLAKAAVYTRTKFGMRSISHVVAAELAKRVKGEKWTKSFYDKVVYRPDDITEILSYYLNEYKKPIPNSLKKGLALAFEKFDEYQVAKYRSGKAALSLIDVVNLVHPKHSKIIEKLVKGELKSRQTWEAKLSDAGKTKDKDEAKKKAWADLIRERKIGYFALLRNLRNIMDQSPEVLTEALEMLVDGGMIKKSLVLPFRYQTAIREIEKESGKLPRQVVVALNKALDVSVKNVPVLEGDTLVVLDSSGSMHGKPMEIGSLFAAVLVKSNNSDFMLFSEDAKYISLNPMDSTLTLAEKMANSMAMGGTNFNAIFQTANKAYDRIIILSDMQGWMGNVGYGYGAPDVTFNNYKKRLGADPIIYCFDLQGYGTLQFPERNIYEIAGFSEKVFTIMELLEKDRNALVSEIEKISF